MRWDFRDLRFRDPLTMRRCRYWIESKTDGSSATIWVRLAVGQRRLEVLYGNGSAESESSGAETMDLFDDFAGAALDSSVWDTYSSGNGLTLANSVLTITGNASEQRGIKSKTGFGVNTVLRARCDLPRVVNCPIGYINAAGDQFAIFAPTASVNESTETYKSGYETRTYIDVAGTTIKEIRRKATSGVDFVIDGTVKTSHTVRVPNDTCLAQTYSYNNTGVITVDWIAVRKYAATEPTFTKIRTERNVPRGTRYRNAIFDVPIAIDAEFTADVVTGRALLSVQFTDQSTGSPTGWEWDFGDGGTSTDQNPAHIYYTPGTYTVALTVTKGLASNTETKTGYITVTGPAPTANFTADVRSGALPLTVSFSDLSSNVPTSWAWNFDHPSGTLTSSAQNPTVDFSTRGWYSVSLTASNAEGGDSELKRGYIHVTDTDMPLSIPTLGWALVVNATVFGQNRFLNLQIRDRLNQVPRVDWRFHSMTATDLTYATIGATFQVYYNNSVRAEGVIEKIDHQESMWYWDVNAYGCGRLFDYRRTDAPALYPVGVQGENTVKDIIDYIVHESCAYPTAWEVTGDDGPDLLIYKIQNAKVSEHVTQLIGLADMDWKCSMITDGYAIEIGDIGETITGTNLKHFRDIINSDEVSDLSKVANNIVIQSKDVNGITIISSIGDYTNVCEMASSETLLSYDIPAGAPLLYVFDHADFPDSGSLYVSTEIINYSGKSTPASLFHPHFWGLVTTATHTAYEPVMLRDGFYITGATGSFLDTDTGSVIVGRETVSYASVVAVDATTALVSGPLSRGSNYYAHGRGAPVLDTAYTLASPTTGTSVATFGRKDEVISGIGYQDQNSLDLAAYGILRRKCGWPTWGEAYVVGGDFPTTLSKIPEPGDWITIEDATTTATELVRITGIDYDMMRAQIKIAWGQNEEYAVADLKRNDTAWNMAMQ